MKALFLSILLFSSVSAKEPDFLDLLEQSVGKNQKAVKANDKKKFNEKSVVRLVDDGDPEEWTVTPIALKKASKKDLDALSSNKLALGEGEIYTFSFTSSGNCKVREKEEPCSLNLERLLRKNADGTVSIMYKDGSWHKVKTFSGAVEPIRGDVSSDIIGRVKLPLEPSQYKSLTTGVGFKEGTSDPEDFKLVDANYRLDKNPACRELIYSGKPTRIDYKGAYDQSEKNIDEFVKKHKLNRDEMPKETEVTWAWDNWSHPNEVARLNFANKLFKKTGGKVLFQELTGGNSALITFVKNGKTESRTIEIPHFMDFCNVFPDLERRILSLLTDYKKEDVGCLRFIQDYPLIDGTYAGSGFFSRLNLGFNAKGEVSYNEMAANLETKKEGNSEVMVFKMKDPKENVLTLKRSPTGRFEGLNLVYKKDQYNVIERDISFKYVNNTCSPDQIKEKDKWKEYVMPNMDDCVMSSSLEERLEKKQTATDFRGTLELLYNKFFAKNKFSNWNLFQYEEPKGLDSRLENFIALEADLKSKVDDKRRIELLNHLAKEITINLGWSCSDFGQELRASYTSSEDSKPEEQNSDTKKN